MREQLKPIEDILGNLADHITDCRGAGKSLKVLSPRSVEARCVTAKSLHTAATHLAADVQKLVKLTNALTSNFNASPSQQPSTTAAAATAASSAKEDLANGNLDA